MHSDPISVHYFYDLFYVRRTWRNFIVERREHLSSYAPGPGYFEHFATIRTVFKCVYRSARYESKRTRCAHLRLSIAGDFNTSFNYEKCFIPVMAMWWRSHAFVSGLIREFLSLCVLF